MVLGLALGVCACGNDDAPDPAGAEVDNEQAMEPSTADPGATQEDPETPPPSIDPSTLGADPGAGPWEQVPTDRVLEVCGLDPELLAVADSLIERPWGVVRHGQLCHQYYPDGEPASGPAWSVTKTLAATALGAVAFHTRDLERTGPKTGPLSDLDRVDHWLDEVTYNPDAHLAHVMGMVAHTDGLDSMDYDAVGDVQINTLSTVANVALAQVPEVASDFDDLVQNRLFAPLGMENSVWQDGVAEKVMAYGWLTVIPDMLRLGLLLVHNGWWDGEQLLGEEWVYRMTHPSFEEATADYGYLTWLNGTCAPRAINRTFPHGLSTATDCGGDCEQQYDVGVFTAAGLGGQFILGHRGLDLVLAIKDAGEGNSQLVWEAFRPALVAADPVYQGDEEAFCRDYEAGDYAPDL